jgi:glycosyltransferase involved in cell wall biosynthesis
VTSTALPVLLDAQSLTTVVDGSGTGTYVRGLIGGLQRSCPDIALSVLAAPEARLEGTRLVPVQRMNERPRARLMENAARLPLDVRRQRRRTDGAVFHHPSFHAPWGMQAPWVQTLHDVIPLVFDAPDLAALRARWQRFGPRYRQASAVIAVSQHAADEGIRLLGLNPKRVHVAWHGVSERYQPSPGGPSDPPYLLVVSEFSARKGFAEAFAVNDALVDAGYHHRLVVAGRVHDGVKNDLARLHAAARHPERIDIQGFVPDLVALYQGATAFLMTSHYEGFGLPPLEAMACGVPVVAFANSSVTEVVEGGGELVANGDVPAMVVAVRRLLDHTATAAEASERGIAHAAQFTWDRSAAIHADVYRSVAEAGH